MAGEERSKQAPGPTPGASPWPAIFVTCVLGPGSGHAFVGLVRRGIALWLAFMVVGVGYAAAIAGAPASAPWVGLVLVPVAAYSAAIIDLLVISRARLKEPSGLRLVVFWLASIVLSVALAIGIRVRLLEAYKVPAGSMMPSLLVGDHFFVSKLGPIERGSVVVFRFPENREQDFVKRVIGVGGDQVETRGVKLFVNGQEVPVCSLGRWRPEADRELDLFLELLGPPHLIASSANSANRPAEARSWTVPQGHVFVMGDNRDNAHDSRAWYQGRGGTVPAEDVKGRAVTIFLRHTGAASGLVDKPTLPPGAEGLQPNLDACLARHPAR